MVKSRLIKSFFSNNQYSMACVHVHLCIFSLTSLCHSILSFSIIARTSHEIYIVYEHIHTNSSPENFLCSMKIVHPRKKTFSVDFFETGYACWCREWYWSLLWWATKSNYRFCLHTHVHIHTNLHATFHLFNSFSFWCLCVLHWWWTKVRNAFVPKIENKNQHEKV